MRIDQLLKKLCLIKTRSIAKKACDKNLVKINDKIVKASTNVNDGNIIEYRIYGYFNKLRIINVPRGNVSKNSAPQYYEILEWEKLELE